jgi:hypothetical protein
VLRPQHIIHANKQEMTPSKWAASGRPFLCLMAFASSDIAKRTPAGQDIECATASSPCKPSLVFDGPSVLRECGRQGVFFQGIEITGLAGLAQR